MGNDCKFGSTFVLYTVYRHFITNLLSKVDYITNNYYYMYIRQPVK